MKHSELKLDTVYANRDGKPLMLLSLEKFAIVKPHYHGGRPIRRPELHDRATGVLIAQWARWGDIDWEAFRGHVAAFQATVDSLTRETMASSVEVRVVPTSSVISTWDVHQELKHAEAEAKRAAESRRAEAEAARSGKLKEIARLLPKGVSVRGGAHTDQVTLSQDDLLTILKLIPR
ncbi:MAG: hypothetical protein J0J04_07910 [Microbacterium sp.]|uniref:hypothetical protein n=1 Tax=Microbacterium sp. TaxID=51671 RepID=UPI001AC831A7|nr:hypothetical protein [Microbacterium sp.]MBN9214724.1 hypothetical protein [Microbacterium sp.]